MRIVHLADIHIKERDIVEYYKILEESFFPKLMGIHPDLIVIAGDLFDSKVKLTPKEIRQGLWFLEQLTNISDVILIPGNHDCNMNDPDQLDLITPLIEKTSYYNRTLFYWSSTGVYPYKNIDFHVWSCIDRCIPDINASNNISIALVHHSVGSAIFQNNMVCPPNEYATLTQLKKYNAAFLGDIHKHQYLTPTIAYPGSLIQQNVGEDPLDHGLIIWNVETSNDITSKFVRISNPTGSMVKLCMSANKIQFKKLGDISKIKSYVIEQSGCSNAYIKSIHSAIMGKHPDAYCQQIKDMKCYAPIEETKDNIAFTPMLALKQWLTHNNIDLTLSIKVMNCFTKINTEILDQSSLFGQTWVPLYMAWKGFANYKFDNGDNYINFSELSQGSVVALLGRNKSGKSSVLDIMVYLLFNKSFKSACKDLVCKDSTGYFGVFSFESMGDIYTIIRMGGEMKHQSIYLTKNGENITPETIPAVYKFLAKILGDYNNFLNINLSYQSAPNFVDMSGPKQMKYIYQLLSLDKLTFVESECKSQIRECKAKLKVIDDFHKPPPKSYEAVAHLPKLVQELNNLQTTLASTSNIYIHPKLRIPFCKNIQPADKLLTDDQYHYYLKVWNQQIGSYKKTQDVNVKFIDYTKKINILQSILQSNEIKLRYDDVKSEWDSLCDIPRCDIPDKSLEQLRVDLALEEQKIQGCEFLQIKPLEYKHTQKSLESIQLEIKELGNKIISTDIPADVPADIVNNLKFSDICNQCEHNRSYINHGIRKAKLPKLLNQLKCIAYDNYVAEKNIIYIKSEINEVVKYNKWKHAQEVKVEYDQLEGEYIKLTDIYKKRLDLVKLARTEQQSKIYTILAEHTEAVLMLKDNRDIIVQKIDKLTNTILDIKCAQKMIKNYENKKIVVDQIKSKLETLEILVKALNAKKGGFPAIIFNTFTENIQRLCNGHLQNITDFNINISPIQSSNWGVKINNLNIQNGSGFQKFIVGILMRVAFASCKPLSSQFIIIDEGFGSCDREHLQLLVKECLPKIASNLRFLLLISHQDSVQAFAQQIIRIDTPGHLQHGSVVKIDIPELLQLENSLIKKTIKLIKIQDVDIIDGVLTDIEPRNGKLYYRCNICNKDYVVKKNAKTRHVASKAHIAKSNKLKKT